MPLTSYCKKCAADVPVGSVCPHCGAKLAPSAVRLAWCVDHTPVRDWMCWNAVMRIVLPMLLILLALLTLLEAASSGWAGVETLLAGGVWTGLLVLLSLMAALMLLILLLQGDDVLDCVMDSKGIHVRQFLMAPTPLRLLARMKSPALLPRDDDTPAMLLLNTWEIAWKDIRRVQLWPEKTMLLLYAPAWWLRLPLPCTPFTWPDALEMIREKLGRKKDLRLPAELIAPPKAKSPKPTKPAKEQQLSMADMPPQEEENGFVPLEDVLQEIKEAEAADRETS